jgi:hypothetical protein
MPTTYRVQIRGASGTAPETAAVRLIASLPMQWAVTLLGCTDAIAAFALILPGNPSPGEVAKVVDDALADSAMRSWTRDGPVT